MSVLNISALGFAQHLMNAGIGMGNHTQHALHKAAELVQHESRELLGHDQAEWPPLSEMTIEQRERYGISSSEPLEITGKLREAIDIHVEMHSMFGGEAAIGVADGTVGSGGPLDHARDIGLIAQVHELGDGHVPERSFLALAAHKVRDKVIAILGHSSLAYLVSK